MGNLFLVPSRLYGSYLENIMVTLGLGDLRESYTGGLGPCTGTLWGRIWGYG